MLTRWFTGPRWLAHLRVVLALFILGASGLYQQAASLRQLHHKPEPRYVFLPQVRGAVERSAHPEIYRAGSTFQFVEDTPSDHELHMTRYYVLRYALAPARLDDGPTSDRLVVFFNDPSRAPEFESANGLRLLDTLSEDVRVYQRGQQ